MGNEFATLDRELPEAVDRNAIAVVDRGIQTLKKDLATRVARKGGQWSDHFERAAGASTCRSVVTTKFPSFLVSSRAARLVARPTVSAFLFCRGGGLPGEDVHHHQAVLRLPPRVLAEVDEVACSRSFGPSAANLPSARGRGACTCRPTSAFSASKAMACVTSRSRCRASRCSFRGSRTLKSSARSLSASI